MNKTEFVTFYYYRHRDRINCPAWLDNGRIIIKIGDKFYVSSRNIPISGGKGTRVMRVEFLFRMYIDKKYDIVINEDLSAKTFSLDFIHESGLTSGISSLEETKDPNIDWDKMIEIFPYGNPHNTLSDEYRVANFI